MKKKIRFAGIMITNPKRRRFLRLWLYLSRVEVHIFKLYVKGAIFGVIAHYLVLIPLTVFTQASINTALILAYATNYNIKFFYHKYRVFKDRSLKRLPFELVGYMVTAYINTRLTNEVKIYFDLDFLQTQLYTLVPTTLVMYIISRFIIFKRKKA
mgnify:CR=1 FL=1